MKKTKRGLFMKHRVVARVRVIHACIIKILLLDNPPHISPQYTNILTPT